MIYIKTQELFESENVLLYHVANTESRNSIEKNGLNYLKGISPWQSPEDPIDYPKGNYFWINLKQARLYAGGLSEPMDIWIVNKCNVKDIKEDPVTKNGLYSIYPVDKKYISLLETVNYN